MKNIILFILIFNSVIFASNIETENEKKFRIEQQIKEEIDKEKKYAQEQKFYNNNNYDFKRSEVNQKSLSTIPEIDLDDLNMDSVYD